MWQQFKGSKEAKIKDMATLSLINFPKFSESKGILKIRRSNFQGGVAEGWTFKSRLRVYSFWFVWIVITRWLSSIFKIDKNKSWNHKISYIFFLLFSKLTLKFHFKKFGVDKLKWDFLKKRINVLNDKKLVVFSL